MIRVAGPTSEAGLPQVFLGMCPQDATCWARGIPVERPSVVKPAALTRVEILSLVIEVAMGGGHLVLLL